MFLVSKFRNPEFSGSPWRVR